MSGSQFIKTTPFTRTLLDDASASAARSTLGVDAAGTDNSTNVTLTGTPDYITISGQVITRGQVDLAADVTGDLPLANLAQSGAASRLLGRGSAGGAGDWEAISLGSGLSLSGTTLSATAGTGDVVGPASATDNAISRFDSTTGKLIQNSGITIADGASGTLAGTNSGDITLASSVADILNLTGQDVSADDPGADRIVFWDDSAAKLTHLEVGSGLSISGTTLTATAASGLTRTATKTAAYTAVAGDLVVCDANAAAGNFAVTLPAGTPTVGATVGVLLLTDHATRKVTVGRNSNLINGQASDTLYDLLIEGDYAEFVWEGGGTGWRARRHFTPSCGLIYRSADDASNTANTFEACDFNSVQYDLTNCYDAVTNFRFTARRAGKYRFFARVTSLGGPMTYWGPALDNGTRRLAGEVRSNQEMAACFGEFNLVAGDTIEPYYYSSGTGGMDADNASNGYSMFSFTEIF